MWFSLLAETFCTFAGIYLSLEVILNAVVQLVKVTKHTNVIKEHLQEARVAGL